jgi:hypothetical protein
MRGHPKCGQRKIGVTRASPLSEIIRKVATIYLGTLSPKPWDLTLSGQNVPIGFLRPRPIETSLAEPPNRLGPLAGSVVSTYGRILGVH